MIEQNRQSDNSSFSKALPFFGVASVTLPTLPPGEEIYDVRGVVPVPFPWLSWLGEALLVVLAGFLIVFFWQWLNKPAVRVPRKPKPIDHLKDALDALDRLKRSPVWEEGRVKDVCEHLNLIFKRFLKNQFGLSIGPAATTDELLVDLTCNRVPQTLMGRTARMFRLCDEVKFARGNLGESTLDELLEETRGLLQREDWKS